MTLQERINWARTLAKSSPVSDRQLSYNLLDNQIAIMEALIRIESKFPKEAPFFQEQLNEPEKWEHNNDG